MVSTRRLAFLAGTFAILGAALIIIAVIQRLTSNEGAGGVSPIAVQMLIGLIMVAVGATSSLACSALKAQAAQLERLQCRQKEADSELEAIRESLRARVARLERESDGIREAKGPG